MEAAPGQPINHGQLRTSYDSENSDEPYGNDKAESKKKNKSNGSDLAESTKTSVRLAAWNLLEFNCSSVVGENGISDDVSQRCLKLTYKACSNWMTGARAEERQART